MADVGGVISSGPATTLPASSSPASSSPSLTMATTHGVLWMAALSVATKGLTTITQVVLGKYLNKEEFGLVAIALAIAAFPAVLQTSGLAGVLIRRQKNFGIWADAACSLSVVLGLAACGVIGAIAPIVEHLRGGASLAGLLWVIALATLLGSLGIVPQTKLQIDLKFRMVAKITLWAAVGANLVSIGMAIAGFGAYACVAPPALANLICTAWMWRASGVRLPRRLQLRRWRYLAGDSLTIIATNLVWQVPAQGDRLLLGRMVGDGPTGVYFFGYTLSMQAVQLMAGNLATVLAPTLGKLAADPVRQARAFLRACRTMALVGVPMAGATCVCAGPALHLVFGNKWDEAIPIIQLLSLGMMSYVVSSAGSALFTAQGRFRTFFGFAICSVVGFVTLLALGAWVGGVLGVAGAVSIHLWLASVAGMWLGLRPAGCTLRDVIGVYAVAVIATTTACAAALGAVWACGGNALHSSVQLLILLGVGCATYLLVVRLISPLEFDELRGRARALAGIIASLARNRRGAGGAKS